MAVAVAAAAAPAPGAQCGFVGEELILRVLFVLGIGGTIVRFAKMGKRLY